jgi:hypothetical protein
MLNGDSNNISGSTDGVQAQIPRVESAIVRCKLHRKQGKEPTNG